MKIYIAGKITGDPNYREKFKEVAKVLERRGYKVMNPATLPDGFDYEEYMMICFSMIDVCHAVCLLPDWEESPGAKRERAKARKEGKPVLYLRKTEDAWEIWMTEEVG